MIRAAISLIFLAIILVANPSDAAYPSSGKYAGISGGTSCSYPLPVGSDTVAAAYSFRKLRSAYSGYAVTLYRASDSTTLNVGFAANNCDFNTAAATAFCASTTCSVATWYDQSGNGVNAAQSTVSGQPAYVANCQNGQPCLNIANNTGSYMQATLLSATYNSTFAAVASYNANASAFVAAISYTSTSNPDVAIAHSSSSNGCIALRYDNTPTPYKAIQTNCSTVTMHRWVVTNNSTLGRVFIDGAQGTDSTNSITPYGVGTYLTIGAQPNGGIAANLNGNISELITFAPDISSTDSSTVSSNEQTYWGTL